MNIILASLPQQSFNDALNCYEKLKKIDKNEDLFEFWKYCTWSIISASICMESYLTQYVKCRCVEIGENPPDRLFFPNRIKFLRDTLYCRISLYNSDEFKKIRLARDIRNDIIHYRKENIFDEITEQNAIDSIDACRDLVTFILTGDNKDPHTEASWVFETESRKIK